MTRRKGRHPASGRDAVNLDPRAVNLDPRSVQARAMLQRVRRRDCEGCGTTHVEEYCDDCSRAEGRPVYHLAE